MRGPLSHLPIRVKLMATTIALLVFTIGLYGVMNVQDLRRLHDEGRVEQADMLQQGAMADAQNVTGALAATTAILLSSTSYADLEALIAELRRADPRLAQVSVIDVDGRAVAGGLVPSASAAAELVSITPPQINGRVKTELLGQGARADFIRVTVTLQTAGGAPGGHIEALWSMAHIADRSEVLTGLVEQRKAKSLLNSVIVGTLVIMLGVVLSILQSLRISKPIRDLSERVERIAHGQLKERAPVVSNDEIGVLARNFNDMAERIGVLLKDTKEKATLEKELEVARVIQESLLPPPRLIDKGFIQFQGFFKAASICGGDWWSFADLPGDKLLIVIGDVTGHGVSSAMITAAAKSCCDTLRHVTEGELTCSFLLEELNKTIYEAAHRKFVMTFFATIIDPRARTLTFSNAGHNFPLLFRASKQEGEPAIVPLVTRGNRLGDVVESRFLERTVPFESGDVVVWYTDGLTEGLGKTGEEYGEKRFRRSVQAVLDLGPDAILETVLRDAEAYFQDFTHPEDDITLVVGKFSPSRPSQAGHRDQRTTEPNAAG